MLLIRKLIAWSNYGHFSFPQILLPYHKIYYRLPVVFANLLQPLILKYWKIESNSDVKTDKDPHGHNIQMCCPAKM